MIPKIIHYVWLSGDAMPPKLQECMQTWREFLPDYEIVCWNKDVFDIKSVPFVKEAYRAKKWAFACDYIRLHALYTCGGFYLDSDVLVKKSFDEYLSDDFVTSVEYHPDVVEANNSEAMLSMDGCPLVRNQVIPGIGLQAAIMGSIKQHPFVSDCLNYYRGRHFRRPDGSFSEDIIAPSIFAFEAEKYGFRYLNVQQKLQEGILILPSTVFASTRELATEDSHAVHCCAGSWRTPERKKLFDRLSGKVKSVFMSRD
jgi:hypothetical protein